MAEAVVTALVSTAVSSAISYVLAPDGPDIEGPRLDDRGVQRNSYGTPLSNVYGTMIVTGSLTWLLNNEITETKTTERQGGKGGGGGSKVTSYSYDWTGTNAICQGPINGVQRIWADTTLIYDENAPEDNGFDATEYDFQFSFGYDTQSVTSDESGEKGVENTPAYRGTALHHVDQMQLADFGNRIPNFQYEVAGFGSYDLDTETDLSLEYLGPLVRRYAAGNPEIDSTAGTGVGIRSTSNVLFIGDADANFSPANFNGYFLGQTGLKTPPKMTKLGMSYGPLQAYVSFGYNVIQGAFARNSDRYMLLRFGFNDIHAWYDALLRRFIHGPVDGEAYASWLGGAVNKAFQGSSFLYSSDLAETEGYLWAVDYSGVAGSDIYLCAYAKLGLDPNPVRVWNLTELWGPSAITGASYLAQVDGDPEQRTVTVWPREGNALPQRGLVFTDRDVADGTNPAAINIQTGATETPYAFHNNPRRNWVIGTSDDGLMIFDSTTGEEIFYGASFFSGNSYRKTSVWWMSPNTFTDGYEVWRLTTDPALDAGAGDDAGADLEEVVVDLCKKGGVAETDIDATALAGTRVRGYDVKSLQSIRESLEPLQLAYQFEFYEEDYKLKARFKDRASTLTVTEDDMRPHPLGSDGGEYIEIEQVEESKLPVRINVNYLNFGADYEPDVQFAERSIDATRSKHVADVTLQMSQTPTFARQLADKLLREAWVSRTTYTFSLPKRYSYLTPSDIITLSTDDYTVTVRLLECALGVDGRLQLKAMAHDQAVYTSSVSTDDPVNTNSQFPKLSNAVLNYYLIDSNELAFGLGSPEGQYPIYLAGTSDNFKGYQLQQSTDEGVTWTDIGPAQVNKATIGFVTSTVGDALFPNLFDPVDEIGVYFFDNNPDLSSVTDTAVLGGENVFAVGSEGRWEIIGAATVTQVDTNNFTLSRLYRGAQGTEQNGAMVEGDAVILLNPQTIGQVSIPTDSIGSTVKYRALYGSRIPDERFDKTLTLTGNPLKEYAPAQLQAVPDGSDVDITWARRTRISGAWRDNVGTFLASDSRPEAYKVEIYDDTQSPQLLRTIDASTPTATYTSAQRTTDGSPTTIRIRVYQVSASINGYYSEITYAY